MQYLPIATRDSNINPLFVVAFTYFYFRRPADVKFFFDIIYAPENYRSFSLDQFSVRSAPQASSQKVLKLT